MEGGSMGFTALTGKVRGEVERIGSIDFIVGISSFNNEDTIAHVLGTAAQGLVRFFPDGRHLIIVSDGGSTDGTREVASRLKLPRGIERVVGRYAGVPGKGSAVKMILEAAELLGARGVALVDSDLRSILPDWIELLLTPLDEGGGLVTPYYLRYKYDGFITNQIAYPFTRAVYGRNIRQPIGGEFGLSQGLVKELLKSPLWGNPYTPRFGIDIFITHTAIAHGFPVAEAFLGAKIHGAKDPTKHLAPMFRQVVGSMFSAMTLYESFWRGVKGCERVPLIRGCFEPPRPEPFPVDEEIPLKAFREGFKDFQDLYRRVLSGDLYQELYTIAHKGDFTFPIDLWAKIVYSFASAFKGEGDKDTLLDALRICWCGRVGCFIQETRELGDEEAEERVVEEAAVFEELRNYLLEIYPG